MNLVKKILTILLLSQTTLVSAKTGYLFNVVSSGAALGQTVSFNLCLNVNAQYPLSCQRYSTSNATLTIKTTAPNHTYHDAGIIINTQGYAYVGGQGTSPSGYTYIGPVSHTQSAAGTVTLTTETTLTVTPSTLALSVTGLSNLASGGSSASGTPRVFTVQNTGMATATGVTCPTSTSPSITSITCVGCGTILSNGTCTVTIQPSAMPSAAVADASPTPITLTIQGNNTNMLNPTVNILTYGSFYEAGWLFSIIETTNTSQSIGGTVAAESDNVSQNTTEYSPSGDNTTFAMYSGTNGLSNTQAMVAQYGAGTYSATVCTGSSGGGYTDWYLPAICQMGFGGSDTNFNCGASPGSIPNIQYNLLETNTTQSFNFVNSGNYWSSTASENSAPVVAWFQRFAVGRGAGVQGGGFVNYPFGVRCVRAIT